MTAQKITTGEARQTSSIARALFIRALLVGRCCTVEQVYVLVEEWTGLERDALCVLLWGRVD